VNKHKTLQLTSGAAEPGWPHGPRPYFFFWGAWPPTFTFWILLKYV